MNIELRRKDIFLPIIAGFFILFAVLLQLDNYRISGSFFQLDQIHHESFTVGFIMVALFLLLFYFIRNPAVKKAPIVKYHNPYKLIFYILGGYIILDGFASILIYPEQPLFPDHALRLVRMLVGGIIICLAEKS